MTKQSGNHTNQQIQLFKTTRYLHIMAFEISITWYRKCHTSHALSL